MNAPSIFRRALLCPFGLCQTFRQGSDDNGVWGECSKCGRRSGFVDRETLRSYADDELANRTARRLGGGYQPTESGSDPRPEPPTGGSGVKPPPWPQGDRRRGEPQDDPDAGLTHWQIAEEISEMSKDGAGITMTVYAAIVESQRQHGITERDASSPAAGNCDLPNLRERAALKVLEYDFSGKHYVAEQIRKLPLRDFKSPLLSVNDEVRELFLSERISAAQVAYDQAMEGADPSEPEYEVLAFDAMKAAIARADAVAVTGRV